jgi:hypothetical protein
MTELERASDNICRAIASEDLERISSALKERAGLLKAGAEPTELAFLLGEESARLLGALKQKLTIESSRLEEIHAGLPETQGRASHFDWRG